MNSFTSFSHVLIAFLLLVLSTASTSATNSTTNDTVSQACSKLSDHDPLIRHAFCVSALKSVPESQGADLYKLGLIAIDLINVNVTLVSSQLKIQLTDKELSPSTKLVLNQCKQVYSRALDDLSAAPTDYKNKDFKAVVDILANVADYADTCEEGYNHLKLNSPFTQINTHIFQLAVIVYNILDMIQNV